MRVSSQLVKAPRRYEFSIMKIKIQGLCFIVKNKPKIKILTKKNLLGILSPEVGETRRAYAKN